MLVVVVVVFVVGIRSIPAGFLAEDPNPISCTFAASICAFFFATAAATLNAGNLSPRLGGFFFVKFL